MPLCLLLLAEPLRIELLRLRVDLGVHVDPAAVDVDLVVHPDGDVWVAGHVVLLRANPGIIGAKLHVVWFVRDTVEILILSPFANTDRQMRTKGLQCQFIYH